MNPLARARRRILDVLESGTGDQRRPVLDRHRQSSVAGLFVVGDLAGAPVIKLAMEQGHDVIEHIASLPREKPRDGVLDLVVVGSGAAGLNAALAALDKGLSCIVLEKAKIANTIEDFPEGKWVYAEPDEAPARGKLWLDGATKEELVSRWRRIVEASGLDVRTEEPLESFERADGIFELRTPKGTWRCRRVILATGQRGNPRRLAVPGEDRERVYHRLYSPRKYHDERILVVGGGNSAVEAALTLSERNRVTISYRGERFFRIFKDNERRLEDAIRSGAIEVVFQSSVVSFGEGGATLSISDGRSGTQSCEIECDHAFVLIGADVPVEFLRSLGIRLEGEWTGSLLRAAALVLAGLAGLWIHGGQAVASGHDLSAAVPGWAGSATAIACLAWLVILSFRGDRFAWMGISFALCYTIYGAKIGPGDEFWPFRGWGYEALSFGGRPWSFWYTVLYTVVMTAFGIQAVKRWGIDRKDRFQIWRYASLLGFQWLFFFLVPEFLFQWAVKYQWVGERLASDPTFTDQAWRSYGIVYAWPLFFYTFFYDPHMIWIAWGIFLTFVLIPVFVLFQGKRYCSWICGCGGLAETLGDRWRHLAPKGRRSINWEWMNMAVLVFATAATLLMLGRDAVAAFRAPADWAVNTYRIYADVWLVGILPVTLYPFMGGKVWCRYWCPLAKLMQVMSGLYARLGISRFAIEANDKCIACNECSRNCQVGIDVMAYALKQETLDNRTSSCIGCGICVTVCPMDTLSFGEGKTRLPIVS
jgi:thioredoxin reductase/polyferredoxin